MDNATELFSTARNLLTSRLHGVLASQSLDMPGYPFGSVVPYSLSPAGWPLLLLSHLAKHTRNLLAAPQCSLTITQAGEGDIQKLVRLSCLGKMRQLDTVERELAERHFRYYPDSRDYFEQLNFRFFELTPERFYCVGGFGTARWVGVEHLNTPSPFTLTQELELLMKLNSDYQPLITKQLGMDPSRPVHLCGIDSQGIDLRLDENFHRLHFPQACQTPEQVESSLKSL